MKKVKHRLLSLVAASAMLFSCAPTHAYYEPKTDELGGLSSREVGIRVAEEGMVLLKNENQALPLEKGDTVAVFGINQVDYIQGGGGSGDMTSEYYKNLVDGLKDNGSVTVYEGLRSVYQADFDDYWKNDKRTYGYGSKQGAVIMYRGEKAITDAQVADARKAADTAIITIGRPAGEDKDRENKKGDFLLSDNEKSMVEKVKNANFNKVIVILNVAGVTDTTWFDDSIDAALVVYFPGMDGGRAIADVLCGDAYPSGKLVDTWAKNCDDYASSPYFGTSGNTKYVEDIFVGYRYFETVPNAADKVNYEFGYGLSYTDFEVSGIEVTHDDENITVSADVTNTGDTYSGKEVLQVYYGAPEVKLTQPKKELAAFAKTKELAPGETDHLTVSFPINDMASYDDVGKTGHEAAYVLEAGDYNIYVGTSVRQCEQVYTYNVPELVVTEQLAHRLVPDTSLLTQRMKSDGTLETLTKTTAAPRTPDKYEELYTSDLTSDDKFISFNEVSRDHDLLPYFVNRLTDDEMVRLVGCVEEDKAHGHRTGVGDIPYLGVPLVGSTNGPAGIQYNGASQTDPEKNATFFPCATMQASTWNTELIELLGKAIGLEGAHFGFDLLQAPGMNIHRHPRGGRNFEYFSEDPYITGEMGIALTNGLQSEYVGAQPKHFALNNQETDRWNNNSVCSERAIREIYLKGYEKVVKEAHPWSMMSAYDKINGVNSTANYELLTEILRNEWGFDGFVMTDFYATTTHLGEIVGSTDLRAPYSTVKPDQLRTGLANGTLQRWELQRASHNILNYVLRTRDGVALQTEPFSLTDFSFNCRAALTDGSVLLSENISVKAFMESIVDKYNQKYELIYKDADGNESTVASYNLNGDEEIVCADDIQVGAGMTLRVRSEDDLFDESYPIAIGSLSLKRPTRASATEKGNPPENTVDSVLTTRWSAYVNASKTSENYGNWIEVDLGDIYNLSSLSLYCYRNKECSFTYDVWAKASNEAWDNDVTKGKDFAKNGYKQILSAGKTVKGDKASVQKLSGQGRYIVIKVNSSDNTKAKAPSIYELEINGWKLTSDVYDIDNENKTVTMPAYTPVAEAEKNLNLAGKASLDIDSRGPYVGDSITVVDDLGEKAAVYSVNATAVGETYGIIDFADSLKPEATSSDAGHDAELAVDGDEETFWQAANPGGGESISLPLGAARYVERVRVNMGDQAAPYSVYYDRDGEWVNAGDFNGGEPEIDLGGVSTEKIKIDFTGVGDGDCARLYSLNVYGTMFADYTRETKYLTDMEDAGITVGWSQNKPDKSIDGNPITLSGKVYDKGLGLHADSEAIYNLDENYYRFTAVIGMDDEIGSNGDGAVFEVYGTDGDNVEKLMYSQTVATINDPHIVDLDVFGIKKLRLVTNVGSAGNADGDHTDWAIPMLWGSTRDISTGGDWRVEASTGADKYVRIDRNNGDGTADYFYSKLVYLDSDGEVISERSEGFTSAGNTTIQALKDGAPEGTAFTKLEVRNSEGELIGSGFVGTGEPVPADEDFIYISDIPAEYITQGWEGMIPGINAAIGGRSIKVNGTHYKKGLGLHADSEVVYDLDGRYSRFTAVIGIDDEVNSEDMNNDRDGATFRVYSVNEEGEDELLYERYINAPGTSPTVNVDVSGVKQLRLETNMGGNNAQDHTDWADAKLYLKPELVLDGNTVRAMHAPEGSELIVAVYKDGGLVEVTRTAADKVGEISVSELKDKGDRVSAYLWNTKTMTPLTEALEVK